MISVMQNRAQIIEDRFIDALKSKNLPLPPVGPTFSDSSLKKTELLDLFETQMMSRLLDLEARRLRAKNQCFYTIGSSGHESNAALGLVSRVGDIAFLHYRSCPFLIQRSKKVPGQHILHDLFCLLLRAKRTRSLVAGIKY